MGTETITAGFVFFRSLLGRDVTHKLGRDGQIVKPYTEPWYFKMRWSCDDYPGIVPTESLLLEGEPLDDVLTNAGLDLEGTPSSWEYLISLCSLNEGEAKERIHTDRDDILSSLAAGDFSAADNRYKRLFSTFWNAADYERIKFEERTCQERKQHRKIVLANLARAAFHEADTYFQAQCADWWQRADYQSERDSAERIENARVVQRKVDEIAREQLIHRDHLQDLLRNAQFIEADAFFEKACASWLPQPEYNLKKKQALEADAERTAASNATRAAEERKRYRDKVEGVLQRGAFEQADSLYQLHCTEWWSRSDYDTRRREAVRARTAQLHRELRARIGSLLLHGKLDAADKMYTEKCSDWWGAAEYDALRVVAVYRQELVSHYSVCSLLDLDRTYGMQAPGLGVSNEQFARLKLAKIVMRLARIGMRLDQEQMLACARPEQAILIKARAGSGKTRTLAAIAALAINDQNLDPDQVMLLAFNAKAAREVGDRVRKCAGIRRYRNARTFHSLAHRLAGATGRKLLFDNGKGDSSPSQRKQSQFVEDSIRVILSREFKEQLYEFFRRELEQIERIGVDLPKEEYFVLRRAMVLVTLSGESVKSNGEKFIADFLFEHDIAFDYEKPCTWERADLIQGLPYHPDFSIKKGPIIEHWAIDPSDPDSMVPKWWEDTSTLRYRQQIDDKRKWCRERQIPLIETHTSMLTGGRETFEIKLKELLEENSIRCVKLSDAELIRRVAESPHTISRMAGLFLQFIQRAKKRGWSVDAATTVIRNTPDPEPRNVVFHELALLAYAEYERRLDQQSAMDFDDLLAIAAERVEAHGATLAIATSDRDSIELKDLRWILLDEYQDFSELYYRMLAAILEVNPKIRIVAVGDDWQAINGFAGAQLTFFKDFQRYFARGGIAGVSTNYRSEPLIVEAGNRLMKGRGISALAFHQGRGEIVCKRIEDYFVDFRDSPQYAGGRKRDAIYFVGTPHRSLQPQDKPPSLSTQNVARALKACAEFILESWSDGDESCPLSLRDVLLVSRTGYAYGLKLNEFSDRLVAVLEEHDLLQDADVSQHIDVLTAHRAKGKEADTVIVMEATSRQFPKVHADNVLFGPFGVTAEDTLEEERRLFYVAITRAKRRLMLLTVGNRESSYLAELGLHGSVTSLQSSGIDAKPPALNGPIIDDLAQSINVAVCQLGQWDMCKNNLSPILTPLLKVLELSDIPAPAVGHFIQGDEVELCAELAWPTAPQPVSILTGIQIAHAQEWKDRGWRVVTPEMSVDGVIKGLRKYIQRS
jgi:DNA helicase-4